MLLAAPSAFADNKWEIGGFAGFHDFNTNNELGVADVPNANSLQSSFIGGVRLSYELMQYFGIEAELGAIPTVGRTGDVDVIAIAYRLHPIVHFADHNATWRPFVVIGGGGMVSSSNDDALIDDDNDLQLHAGVGFKYRLEENWGVRADGRVYLPPSSEDDGVTVDWELLLGLYKTFRDNGPATPAAPVDADGDGITDDVDKCPAEAEDVDGFEDEDGCPETDNDGDGIDDANDKCRDQAEDKNGIDDEDGCPETDNDGDGLLGSQDKCPNEAEDVDGFEDTDGCPDKDNDADGVEDANDKCPTELETANGFEDGDGCPDELPKALAKFTGTIKGITFASGSDVILRRSYRTLNGAVKVLKEYPDTKLEISGHTDDRGGRDMNVDLSQKRANSVKAFLVNKGIGEARISTVGYGPDKPVADNTKASGRSQNRRVEFKLVN